MPLIPVDDTFRIAPGEIVHYRDLLDSHQILGRTGAVLVGATGDDTRLPTAVGAIPNLTVTPQRGGLYRVYGARGTDDLALARVLDQLPGVEFAVPDLILPLTIDTVPNDPYYSGEWHLENTGQSGVVDTDIDAETAWLYATGAGQLIAIIDTGTQPDHPDLRVTMGYDYVDHDNDATPDYTDATAAPHGTGTAGIAAASGNNGIGVAGVAYDADIYAIRLIGGATSTDDVYNAFAEAVDAGASVLSNSWGYGTCDAVSASSVFSKMYRYAENKGRGGLGSVVVFAAGNDNCDTANNGMLSDDRPVVVAALESNDVRSWYSDYGDAVDISAPTNLLTTDWTTGGYGTYNGDDGYYPYFSGTSGATPVVAGVFALMFAANPRLTAADARDVLCETAVKVDLADVTYDSEGRNPYYGCGRVNAGAAVAAVANTAPEAPTVPADATVLPGPHALTWSPAFDADNDALRYVVRWSVSGPAPTAATGAGDTGTVGASVDSAADSGTDSATDTAPDSRAGADSPIPADSGASDTGDTGAAPVPTSGEITVNGTFYRPPVAFVDTDVVTWTVAAVDPWGEGPASATATLTVAAPVVPVDTADTDTQSKPKPTQKSGCTTAPASTSVALLLAGLLASALLRRRS